MTMTVKLDAALELQLRQRSAALGRPAGDIIREALHAWLAATPDPHVPAHALGADLFGLHSGPPDLAQRRKEALADVWAARHAARG